MNPCNRRVLLLGLAFLGVLAGLGNPAQATEPDEAALSEAIHFLAHEKSAAEQYGVILSTVGKSDTAQYVRGIMLYADAKAEFDALITEPKFDLTTGQHPGRSAIYTEALQKAAAKRVTDQFEHVFHGWKHRPIRGCTPADRVYGTTADGSIWRNSNSPFSRRNVSTAASPTSTN